MTDTETRLKSLKTNIEDMFSKAYPNPVIINDNRCFQAESGCFMISIMGSDEPWDCLVIEYADSIEDMEKHIAEDGDLYYESEFSSIEEMFNAMLAEAKA